MENQTGIDTARPTARSKCSVARKRPEDELTRACAEWVEIMRFADDRYNLVFSVQNERHVSPQEGARWNKRGRKKGVSDWIILCASKNNMYTGAAIELKAGKNKATEEQMEFLNCAYKHGNMSAICRSFDAFQKVVTQYMEG